MPSKGLAKQTLGRSCCRLHVSPKRQLPCRGRLYQVFITGGIYMIKIFISQPMRDKTNEQIEAERARAVETVKSHYGDDVEIIDSFFKDAPHEAKPLWFLGKSFELLSTADVAYFVKGWDKYRGCKMEHTAAMEYGIDVIAE